MTLVWHKHLQPDRWSRYSQTQQVLMVASEFSRAEEFERTEQVPERVRCYERALELIDLCTTDLRWKAEWAPWLRWRALVAESYLESVRRPALTCGRAALLYASCLEFGRPFGLDPAPLIGAGPESV